MPGQPGQPDRLSHRGQTGQPIVCTVDVEWDWETDETKGLEIVLPRMLELLDRYDASATFFVVGELGEQFRRWVAPSDRHEVGSHGMTHAPLTRLDREAVRYEVRESKRTLEAQGFTVAGFRAPMLRCPKDLPALLVEAGYTYDTSGGSVLPGIANAWSALRPGQMRRGIRRLATSTLRDRLTPFSLTWMRLYHPLALHMVSSRPGVFRCHLHEFLDDSPGWGALPSLLRRWHARNTGATAWRILESLLNRGRPVVTCREFLRTRSP